jgi:TolA-binding protein
VKASEKVLECIWECLFGNLVAAHRATDSASHNLPWLILSSVEKNRMTNYLARACNVWSKEGKLSPPVLATLQSYTGTERNGPAWMLLGLISAHIPCKDPQSVMEYFSRYIKEPEGVGLYTLLQVLKVLFASVSKLSQTDRTDLQQLLLGLIRQFQIPPDLISVAVDVITVVSSLDWPPDKNMKQFQSAVDGWAVPIIETIDSCLSAVFLREIPEPVDERLLMRQVFILGELCQICPHRSNNRLYLLMQSIVFQQPGTDLTALQLPELPSTQTQSTQPPVCRFVPSSKLQALTIVTLGKMCLQNESQAKKIIPAFGQILETTPDPSIKNNIMYALTDMCVRYASLVDPLLPQMTACLRDRFVAVRRTTLILLIHLLQEDYLKIRGNGRFFFRILQAYQDPSEEIRHLTTFYLQQRLLKRIPKIMYSNFVESLFHFNDYTSHASYNKFIVTEKEKKMFNMSGSANQPARRELYCFMLTNMNDEERFQTTYRLSQDILGGVVEGTVSLGTESLQLLQDTFFCLASDQIKLQSLKSKAGAEDEPETEQDMAGKVMEAAKKTIISGAVKKNVIENIIPIIIALKHKLESIKSPLISDLFSYLRRLMEDFKTEVSDILSADKQLAKEIEFELRRFDKLQEERDEQERERQEQERVRQEQEKDRVEQERREGRKSIAPSGSGPSTPTSGTPRRRSVAAGGSLAKQAFQAALGQSAKKIGARRSIVEKNISRVEEREAGDGKSKVEDSQLEKDKTNVVISEGSKSNGCDQGGSVEKGNQQSINNESGPSEVGAAGVENEAEVVKNQTVGKGSPLTDEGIETPGGDSLRSSTSKSQRPSITNSETPCTDEGIGTPGTGPVTPANENGIVTPLSTTSDPSANNETPTVNGTETPATSEVVTPVESSIENVESEIGEPDKEGDKSKRVSGKGMARYQPPKTPSTRITHNRRAISTPQVNKTVLAGNVTFMGESVLDLSSITVLSPPSSVADPDSRRGSSKSEIQKDDSTASSAVAFKFRKSGKDMFDEIIGAKGSDAQKEGNPGKRKLSPEVKEDSKRSTRRSSERRKTGSNLDSIDEERTGAKK